MVKIGFKTSQWGVDWGTLLATWELADEMEVFDSGWLFDHLIGIEDERPVPVGSHEAWTVASALASRTSRLQFGHLVLNTHFRPPALLARMAATLDHVAGPDRLVIGLGAGWLEEEHAMFGWPFPGVGERLTRMQAAVRTLKGMWQNPDGFSQAEGPYPLSNAVCHPAPLTEGGPPIWLGTQGKKRGLRILAECADGWNANGPVAEFEEKYNALMAHCDAVGRDPAEIEISAQLLCRDLPTDEVLAAADTLVRSGVGHIILVFAAESGPAGLRKFAAEVARPLRERHGHSA